MASNQGNTLQATYLNDLRKQRMSVVVYLINGIRLTGTIESFDQHAVLLHHGAVMQLIYKHTIASIMPAAKALPASATPTEGQVVQRAVTSTAPVITRKMPRRASVRES